MPTAKPRLDASGRRWRNIVPDALSRYARDAAGQGPAALGNVVGGGAPLAVVMVCGGLGPLPDVRIEGDGNARARQTRDHEVVLLQLEPLRFREPQQSEPFHAHAPFP